MIIKDANGNTWDSDRFENAEMAAIIMDSCIRCVNCHNCSYCCDCNNCTDCSSCISCTMCSGCSGCTDTLDSANCYNCDTSALCQNCCRSSDISQCDGYCRNEKPELFVPSIYDIHKAVYAASSSPESLDMCYFHGCETQHCRAGWVVHLAGEAGYKLESATNTVFAAIQIYQKSGYAISPVRFFESNEVALKDMKRLAT